MPKTRRSNTKATKSKGSKNKGSKSKGSNSKGSISKINNPLKGITRKNRKHIIHKLQNPSPGKNLHLKHDMKKWKPMKGGFGIPSPLINMYHGAGYFFGNIYTTLIGVPGNAHFLPTMGQYASSLAI